MKTIKVILTVIQVLVLIGCSKKTAEDYYEKAMHYYSSSDVDDKINYLSKAIELDSQMVKAYIERGKEYKNIAKYNEALQDFNIIVKIDSNKYEVYEAYVNTSEIFESLHDRKNAIEKRLKAVEYSGISLTKDYLFIAIQYDSLKDFKSSAYYYNYTGYLYYRSKDYKNAKFNYLKSFELDSISFKDYLNLAYCENEIKEYDKAIKYYTIEIEKNNTSSAHNSRGLSYFYSGMFEKAIEDYYKAIELDSNSKYPYANIADVFRKQNRYDECIVYSSISISKDTSYRDPYFIRGIAYCEQNKLDSCLIDFDKSNFTRDAEFNYYYGKLCYKLGNIKKTESYYLKAIDLDSTYSEAYFQCGILYSEMKQLDKACKYFKKAAELGNKEAKLNLFKSCSD